jgi:tetrahydromethanopterin S-methyltransferase subunit F
MSAAAAAPAPAPAQGPDMGRLVEEVVRRLERIGRDERLRRGL